MERLQITLPQNLPVYQADVPFRGPFDFGKWSDVGQFLPLLGSGAVLNASMRLRPFGGNGPFKGVTTTVIVKPATIDGGMITISAGTDPDFDARVSIKDLYSGAFDHGKLSLAAFSMLGLDRNAPCDYEASIISAIGQGASTGTSASKIISDLRAFLGGAFDSDKLWQTALHAEHHIAKRNTGNQDHIAAAMGSRLVIDSPVQLIEIESLFQAKVATVPLGRRIGKIMRNAVLVFIGSHNSSDIHKSLIAELSADSVLATKKLVRMRDTAYQAKAAIESDEPELFSKVLEESLLAQRGLSEMLVNKTASGLIDLARRHNSVGSFVPGAGGHAGSAVSFYAEKPDAAAFVAKAKTAYPACRFYEIALAGDPNPPM